LIRLERSGHDVHQRALARTVLADERVHFAFTQFEIDAVECDRRTKRLVNFLQRERRHGYNPRYVIIPNPVTSISFSDSVRVADDVLISNLQEESVILNLNSERYFGLDDVGTRMLSVLTTSDSIETAYESLAAEYDVDRQALRVDLIALVENLLQQGLVKVEHG
jgi:hypothetical protein